MPPEVGVSDATTWTTRPLQGGRYRIEIRPHLCPHCVVQTPHAFLWLAFLQAEVETAREISDVICSRCEPERFGRLQTIAPQLA